MWYQIMGNIGIGLLVLLVLIVGATIVSVAIAIIGGVIASVRGHETPPIDMSLLDPYLSAIDSLRCPCRSGERIDGAATPIGVSKEGGFPDIAAGFKWPFMDDAPLNFLLQIACADLPQVPTDDGVILFFFDLYDARGCVLHQREPLTRLRRPLCVSVRTFGLFKKNISAELSPEVAIEFTDGMSLPTTLDGRIDLPDDERLVDAYDELRDQVGGGEIVCGGFPDPVQCDDMEEECVTATGKGTPASWQLLLQHDGGDRSLWGDGLLYCFVEESALAALDFSDVQFQTQYT